MLKRTLLLAMAFALVGGACAEARKPTIPTTETMFALALRDAELYWGGVPCGGSVTFRSETQPVTWSTPFAGSMWSSWDDWGTYETATEAATYGDWGSREGPEFDASRFTNCVISYSPTAWPTSRSFYYRWPEFSEIIGHEVEHLLNLWQIEPTSDGGTLTECQINPRNVNYPTFTGYIPWPAREHYPAGAPHRQRPDLYSRAVC